MTGFEWLGATSLDVTTFDVAAFGVTTLAFLAPLPPERPERRTPEPLRGSEWAAVVVIGSIFLMTVVPMVTIWSFHRPHNVDRARCAAFGGHSTPAALGGSGPHRCDRAAGPP